MATYTPPSISNYNDNPPTNDGSESLIDNGVDWNRHIDEIGDPIHAYVDAVNAETDAAFDRVDAGRWLSVTDRGATGDGSTDDSGAIQTAIDEIEADGGGVVFFPEGVYVIATGLTITQPVRLVGVGRGSNTDNNNGLNTAVSVIKYTGSAGIMIEAESNVTDGILFGGAIIDINLDGNDLATYGFYGRSVGGWDIRLRVTQCTTTGVRIDDSGNAQSAHNNIDVWFVWGVNSASNGCHGVVVGGNVTLAGAPQNRIWVRGLIYDGDMLRLEGSDNCICHHVMSFTQSGGTGISLRFLASATKESRNHLIHYVVGDIDGDAGSYGNRILHTTSEGQTITLSAGGQMHYDVVDYVNAECYGTHKYKIQDKFHISSGQFQPDGTNATVESASALWKAVQMPSGVTGWAAVEFPSMFDWNTGTITSIELTLSCDGTTAGNGYFRFRIHTPGQLATIATPDSDENAALAINATADVMNIRTHTFASPIVFTAGDTLLVRIERIGADALDTNTDNIFLLGATLNYASDGPDSAGSGPYVSPPTGI